MPNQTPSGPCPATAAVLSFSAAGKEQSRLAPQWLSGAGYAAGVSAWLCVAHFQSMELPCWLVFIFKSHSHFTDKATARHLGFKPKGWWS